MGWAKLEGNRTLSVVSVVVSVTAALLAWGCGGSQNGDMGTTATPADGEGPVVDPERLPDAPMDCPENDPDTFVLLFNADNGGLRTAEDGAFPVGGQRIVVCVENPDYRDTYRVTTAITTIDSGDDAIVARTVDLGGDAPPPPPGSPYGGGGGYGGSWRHHHGADGDPVEVMTTGERGEPAGTGGRVSKRIGGASDLGAACGGEKIAQAIAYVESHRSHFLARLEKQVSGRMDSENVEGIRAHLRHFAHPRDTRSLCPNFPDAAEGEVNRCSLEQYINMYRLPRWLWYVDGQFFFNSERFRTGDCQEHDEPAPEPGEEGDGESPPSLTNVPAGFSTDMPPAVRSLVWALHESMEKARLLENFSEELLADFEPPTTVFDLGAYGDNRIATIMVSRRRRFVTIAGNEARITIRERSTLRRQEVHRLTYFRVEPGFLFTNLRRPEYGFVTNETGDEVLVRTDDGIDLFQPVVFASFYWCGTNLHMSPYRRRCHGMPNGFGRVVPFLPTLTIGIPIDSELFTRQTSFFIGGLVNWIPYVSIGAGIHIGMNVPVLRDGVVLGQPSRDWENASDLVEERTQISWYISLSIAPDVWTQMRGFHDGNSGR